MSPPLAGCPLSLLLSTQIADQTQSGLEIPRSGGWYTLYYVIHVTVLLSQSAVVTVGFPHLHRGSAGSDGRGFDWERFERLTLGTVREDEAGGEGGRGEVDEAGDHPLLYEGLERGGRGRTVQSLERRRRTGHQVGDQPLTHPEVHPGQADEELGGLLDTAGVALPELAQLFHRAPLGLRQLLHVSQCKLCKGTVSRRTTSASVLPRMSAFSSLEMFSPSEVRQPVMMSFKSS